MTTPKNILIACGGTGGHLFPGIAVAQELLTRGHRVTLLISEKKVDAQASAKYTELDFITLPAIAKPPTFSPKMIPFLFKLWGTIGSAKKIIRARKIDLVLGMGGFTSFPPIYAAHKLGLPTFIHDSNAIPGRANRLTAKSASEILLGFQTATKFFPGKKTTVTGTPVRAEMLNLPSQNEARKKLGLQPEKPTLLIMGGSQGAQHLNTFLIDGTADSPWQILHLTGQSDHKRVEKLTADRPDHHVLAFCDDMPAAYAASDLALIRAGASSLIELTRVGLPSILVPFPYAADDHQTANAQIFADANAAILIQEKDLSETLLQTHLSELLSPEIRQKMAQATKSLAVPNAAKNIADVVTRK